MPDGTGVAMITKMWTTRPETAKVIVDLARKVAAKDPDLAKATSLNGVRTASPALPANGRTDRTPLMDLVCPCGIDQQRPADGHEVEFITLQPVEQVVDAGGLGRSP